MLEKIKQVIASQMDINEDDITEDTVLTDDLGLDSLDIAELVMAFESEYDIELPTEDLENISTVKDIMDLMKKMGVDA